MKKTGEILKQAREEKGLSLHEIGLSLKISSKVLKAIEEGDETQLPAKTFLRGFVQSYANFLHLDTDNILELFYEEMGSTKPKPYIRVQQDKTSASTEVSVATESTVKASSEDSTDATPVAAKAVPEASVTPIKAKAPVKDSGLQSLNENKRTKTFIFIGIGIALFALIIFTKKMIDKYSKEAEVPSSEVAQTIEGVTPVEDQPTETLTEVEPETAPSPLENLTAATAAPSAPATSASPSPTAEANSTAAKPTATPSATPTPSPSATPVASATPTATPTASPTPTPSPKPEAGKPVELIVEALDSVEIEYSAPNGKPQKIRLSSEQVHTFKSRSGLRINFSNGGAINLILNGKEIGIPGDLGKPIKLSY